MKSRNKRTLNYLTLNRVTTSFDLFNYEIQKTENGFS
jgi:hypothetical protein